MTTSTVELHTGASSRARLMGDALFIAGDARVVRVATDELAMSWSRSDLPGKRTVDLHVSRSRCVLERDEPGRFHFVSLDPMTGETRWTRSISYTTKRANRNDVHDVGVGADGLLWSTLDGTLRVFDPDSGAALLEVAWGVRFVVPNTTEASWAVWRDHADHVWAAHTNGIVSWARATQKVVFDRKLANVVRVAAGPCSVIDFGADHAFIDSSGAWLGATTDRDLRGLVTAGNLPTAAVSDGRVLLAVRKTGGLALGQLCAACSVDASCGAHVVALDRRLQPAWAVTGEGPLKRIGDRLVHVLYGPRGCVIVCRDVETGKETWRTRTPLSRVATLTTEGEAEPRHVIVHSPAFGDRRVVALADGSEVASLSSPAVVFGDQLISVTAAGTLSREPIVGISRPPSIRDVLGGTAVPEQALHAFACDVVERMTGRFDLARADAALTAKRGWIASSVPTAAYHEATKQLERWRATIARRAQATYDRYDHHGKGDEGAIDRANERLEQVEACIALLGDDAIAAACASDDSGLARLDLLVLLFVRLDAVGMAPAMLSRVLVEGLTSGVIPEAVEDWATLADCNAAEVARPATEQLNRRRRRTTDEDA